MQAERTWSESFIWHIRQAPFQLMHMRQLAENTVGAQAVGAGKITGSKERATLPYRVDPADDADLLYLRLVKFGALVAEKVGGASPRPLRVRQWRGGGDPLGLPSCAPPEAFSLAAEIVQWLEACTTQIPRHPTLTDEGSAYDELIKTIRKMRARYPRAEPRFKTYRPRPCPIPACGETTIEPVYDREGLAGYRCDNCEAQWDRHGTPIEHINSREREGP